LTRELQLIKQEELPYVQIANELSASHPEIKHVYMARGAHITTDSLKMTECLIVKVKTDTSMSPTTIEQLRKWVEVRLQVENVHVDNEFTVHPVNKSTVKPVEELIVHPVDSL
jgi:hypothetical protein